MNEDGTRTEITKPVKWHGFSQAEKLKQWLKVWKLAELHVIAFSEQGNEYLIPEDKAMMAVVLERDDFYALNVITRASKATDGFTPDEESIHPRWPRLLGKSQLIQEVDKL